MPLPSSCSNLAALLCQQITRWCAQQKLERTRRDEVNRRLDRLSRTDVDADVRDDALSFVPNGILQALGSSPPGV